MNDLKEATVVDDPPEIPLDPPRARRLRGLAHWLVALASLGVIVAVLAAAGRTPSGDGPHLIGTGIRLASLLRQGALLEFTQYFSALVAPHLPAGYLPGIAGFLLAGGRPAGALLGMALCFALIWDALRRFADGRLPWTAWVVLIASPMSWYYLEQHGRDVAAAAAVMQALSWLYATRGFADRRASIGFGIWMALGFLTKYTVPMFLVLPCLWEARTLRTRERWRNLGVAIACFGAVALPWYLPYGERVLRYVTHSAGSGSAASQMAGSNHLAGVNPSVMYLLALKDALSWPGVAVLVLGGIVGALTRRRALLLPCIAAAGGLAVLGTLQQAHERYAFPALACLTVLVLPLVRAKSAGGSTGGASALPRAGAVIGGLIVLAVFGPQLWHTGLTYRPDAPAAAVASFDYPVDTVRTLSWPVSRSFKPVSVDLSPWRLDEAVRALAAAHGSPHGTVGFMSGHAPDVPDFGLFLLRSLYLGARWDIASPSIQPSPTGPRTFVAIGPLMYGSRPTRHFDALYVMLPQHPPQELFDWIRRERFRETVRFTLPRGHTGVVYRREAPAR